MNFVADECCDALMVAGLRAAGHDVVYIQEISAGTNDQSVLALATAQERILITEDKDFGELVVRLRLPAFGIILLRMDPADSDSKLSRMNDILQTDADRLAGHFVVVDAVKARFRILRTA